MQSKINHIKNKCAAIYILHIKDKITQKSLPSCDQKCYKMSGQVNCRRVAASAAIRRLSNLSTISSALRSRYLPMSENSYAYNIFKTTYNLTKIKKDTRKMQISNISQFVCGTVELDEKQLCSSTGQSLDYNIIRIQRRVG